MNKFLRDLEKELKKLEVNEKEIKEILADHEEMIDAAQKEGINDEELEIKFGNPKKLAKELLEDIKITNNKKPVNLEEYISFADEKEKVFNLVEGFPVNEDEISVRFNLLFEDVILTTYKGESIQVFENKMNELKDYKIEFKNGKLVIEMNKIKNLNKSFSKNSATFVVLIPDQIKINEGFYKTVSGEMTLNEIDGKIFSCKSTSGDIQISNIKSEIVKISTVSGDIEISTMTTKECEISLVSGDINMENIHTEGFIYFSTVSGDVELSNVECEEGAFKMVSGDLDGEEFYPKKLSIYSITGDINIVNKDSQRKIIITNKKTLSGEINIS